MEVLKNIYNVIVSNPILSSIVAGLILAGIIGFLKFFSKKVSNIIKSRLNKIKETYCRLCNWFRIIANIKDLENFTKDLEELVTRKKYRKQFIKDEFYEKIEYKRSLLSKHHPLITSKNICSNCSRETLIPCGLHIFSFGSYEMPSFAYLCDNCGIMKFYALTPSKLKGLEMDNAEKNNTMSSLDGENY